MTNRKASHRQTDRQIGYWHHRRRCRCRGLHPHMFHGSCRSSLTSWDRLQTDRQTKRWTGKRRDRWLEIMTIHCDRIPSSFCLRLLCHDSNLVGSCVTVTWLSFVLLNGSRADARRKETQTRESADDIAVITMNNNLYLWSILVYFLHLLFTSMCPYT